MPLNLIYLVLAGTLSVSAAEQPYRAGIAFFDAEGALDNTHVSVDVRMRADPEAREALIYVYVRDGERHYEVSTKTCHNLAHVLADTASIQPQALNLPGGSSTPVTTRADGIRYQLDTPYAQSDGGSGRITLASNNGALAAWGERFLSAIRSCSTSK